MADQTVGAALEQEHREIDQGLEEFAAGLGQGEWRSEALGTAARALRRHIYLEEELLFPTLRRGGLVAPVLVMVREHAEIWRALDEVEASDASQKSSDAALEAYAGLARLLDQHNSKEEVILYPAADQLVDPEQDVSLHTFLEQGELPEGWVCEGLR